MSPTDQRTNQRTDKAFLGVGREFTFLSIFQLLVRYLVLHLLARLLHIQLESNCQDEEERGKMEIRRKKMKKRVMEEGEARVEDTGGVAAGEGWKQGWEQEEKSVDNWSTLNGLELGIRLARLENSSILCFTPAQAGVKG